MISLVGSYLQGEESRVLLTVGHLPESGLFLRKSSWPRMGTLGTWADLRGKVMVISMPVLLSGADREVCVCYGLQMLAAPTLSSGGSINKSDHNARGRLGDGCSIRQGFPRSVSPGAGSLSNARESKLNGSHQPRGVLRTK